MSDDDRKRKDMPALGTVVKRSDAYFHTPRYRDYRWLETNWFSWLIPEKAMRCHVRCAFRTNLNVVESLCFIFDNPDPTAGHLGLRYHDVRSHVPMPVSNLDRYSLESGVHVEMTKPLEEWTLRYDGGADTTFDLVFKAMMPPVLTSESGTGDGHDATIRGGHLDQMMHVTGEVRVRGVNHRVDFASPRDHSWSTRPESSSGYGYPMSGNFDFGCFGKSGQDFSFFVQTRNDWADLRRGHVHNAYLIDGGELLRVKTGVGRFQYAPHDWIITAVEYELEDERGRTHLFRGTPKSFYRPGTGCLAVVEWRNQDGEVGYGETNWHGDLYELQKLGKPPQ